MPILLCTVRDCRAPLAREGRRVVCARGHSFDVARSGYINLLQPQDRRSREPGDSADAVAARRRIFERGITMPVDDAIASLVRSETILDAGCGEGHILGMLTGGQAPSPIRYREREQDRPGRLSSNGCGIDISVPAIEAAARRYPDNEWIVANADRFIPYEDASFDVVLSITARLNPAEFRRVIRNDGTLLVAIAGPDDLVELRGHSRDRVSRTVEMFAPYFALALHEQIAFTTEADEATLRDFAISTYRPKRMRGVARITISRDLLLFRPS
jgi:23S rRNA (guanine745-N1)-methyltransferase